LQDPIQSKELEIRMIRVASIVVLLFLSLLSAASDQPSLTTLHQSASLKASDNNGDGFFGDGVAIAGDVIVVGAENQAPFVNGEPNRQGEAYVYLKKGKTWQQVAELTSSQPVAGETLGTSMAISSDGKTIFAGAPDDYATQAPGPIYVFVKPAGGRRHGDELVYASNDGSNNIAFFNINPSNCKLTLVADYPSGGSATFAVEIAISADGKFLYVSKGFRAATINVLKIRTDGSLSRPIQTLRLPIPASVAITPDGKALITTQEISGAKKMTAYTIDPSSGKLTFASGVDTVGAADGLAIDPRSKFIYVGNGRDGGDADVHIADYVFNGIVEPVDSPGGSNCLLFSPNGKLLYFTDQLFATLITLNVAPESGVLSFNGIADDGVGFVDEPSQLARNPSGSLVFTADFNAKGAPIMGIFQASATGTLTLLGKFPLAKNAAATSIAAGSF
jgi:6-phosphogluconolactonase (cycloisomerase 2 family)